MGKNDQTKGFRVYLPADKIVVTTRHITNVETLSAEANKQLRRVLEAESDDELASLAREREEQHGGATQAADEPLPEVEPPAPVFVSTPMQPRRSQRVHRKSTKQKEADADATNDAPDRTALVGNLIAMSALGAGRSEFAHLPDPKTYAASLKSPDSGLWELARQEELRSLQANGKWVVVKKDPTMNLLRTPWVNKKKKDGNGAITQYKCRLVAGGDGQILGRDFDLTFAAVLDMTTCKLLLVFAMYWSVPARHFDVPSAYVKAKQDDGFSIHLAIPHGMMFSASELKELGVDSSKELALQLVKSLYGLKQAGHLWAKLLHDTLVGIGYEQCVTDACLYFLRDDDGITLVGAYVDDLLVTASKPARVDAFFAAMSSLDLKDLGEAQHFLGMRVAQDKHGGYFLDQEATIKELLTKHGLEKANAVRAPCAEEDTATASEDNELLPTRGPGTPEVPKIVPIFDGELTMGVALHAPRHCLRSSSSNQVDPRTDARRPEDGETHPTVPGGHSRAEACDEAPKRRRRDHDGDLLHRR